MGSPEKGVWDSATRDSGSLPAGLSSRPSIPKLPLGRALPRRICTGGRTGGLQLLPPAAETSCACWFCSERCRSGAVLEAGQDGPAASAGAAAATAPGLGILLTPLGCEGSGAAAPLLRGGTAIRQLPSLLLPTCGESSRDCCAGSAALLPEAGKGLVIRALAEKAEDCSQLDTLLEGDNWPCARSVPVEGAGCAPRKGGMAVAAKGRGACKLVRGPGIASRWLGMAEAATGGRLGLHTGLADLAAALPAGAAAVLLVQSPDEIVLWSREEAAVETERPESRLAAAAAGWRSRPYATCLPAAAGALDG